MGKRAGTLLVFAFFCLSAALLSLAEAQGPPRRLAVLDFKNETGDREFSWLSVTVPSTLTTKLNALRSLTIIERTQLAQIIKEQRFQLSDLADPKKAAKFGRLAGAQVVVVGSFARFRNRVLFNVHFVDVETGEVLHTTQARGVTDDADKLFDSLNLLAETAIEALNARVVVAGGERRVERAPHPERISLTAGERQALRVPPAASLAAYRLLGKGHEAHAEGRWEEAASHYRKVVERDPEHAQALHSLGNALHRQGDREAATETYSRALALYRRKRRPRREAAVLNNLGLLHRERGQHDKALESHRRSLEVHRRLGDEHGVARAYRQIGEVHRERGQYDRALEFHQKGLEIQRRLGNRKEVADAYHRIGNIHSESGRHEQAQESHQKGLEITRELDDLLTTARTLFNLGLIAERQRKFRRAIVHMEEAREIYRSLDHPLAQRVDQELQRLRRAAGR